MTKRFCPFRPVRPFHCSRRNRLAVTRIVDTNLRVCYHRGCVNNVPLKSPARRTVRAALVLMALICGCGQHGETTSATPGPTPELTTEQILSELHQGVSPLTSLVVPVPNVVGWGHDGSGAPAQLTPEVREQVLSFLRAAKMKYEATKNGKAALGQLADNLAANVDAAWKQERWTAVMCGIEAYEILVPASVRMARLRERAEVRANRPDVVVKGFFEDNDKSEIYVFVEVTLHPSNEVKHLQIRKGDEFCGLRFVDFVGKLRGITLEYLDIPGETFRAMGP